MARTKAAKPAAEEARPAAVGKLLLEPMRKGYVLSGGRLESDASSLWRELLRTLRQATVRGVVSGEGWPLRMRVSPTSEG